MPYAAAAGVEQKLSTIFQISLWSSSPLPAARERGREGGKRREGRGGEEGRIVEQQLDTNTLTNSAGFEIIEIILLRNSSSDG
jgi:hypothetical protein